MGLLQGGFEAYIVSDGSVLKVGLKDMYHSLVISKNKDRMRCPQVRLPVQKA